MSAVKSHGPAGYNKGCRCEVCMASSRDRKRSGRRSRLDRAAKGEIPPTVKHGYAAAVNWGCRCPVCAEALTEGNREIARKARAGLINHIRGGATSGCPCDGCVQVIAARQSIRLKRENSLSLETAHRHYDQWTGPELELASRRDLSAAEVSALVGRTIHAVRAIRSRLNREPALQRVLGAPQQPDTPTP